MELYNDLLPDPLPTEPMALASAWLATAIAARQQPNPDAMVLATATASGHPSARIVLCKEFDVELGRVSFVTNYNSRKGQDLAENARAALVFHWDHAHRQVRVDGIVLKAPAPESDAYFATRARASQINAWSSEQSRPLPEPSALEERAANIAGTHPASEALPRPDFWGGFRLWLEAIELWVEGRDRFHERIRYERRLDARDAYTFETGRWSSQRLQP
jgi:pyridoxamine 5'-phosphate oxidase